ncbi:MAG: hypothetical protein IT305_14955 [Chloroflexi bacterium]|nr:hypothetical protein [Chloroflexota bacterium]
MPQIREVDITEKQRLRQRTKGYQERESLRQAVANLPTDRLLELEPDEGESLRKIKLNLARAAKEVGRPIGYGETRENTVLAWLSDGEAPKRRRGRRPKAASAAPTNAELGA